VAWSPDGTQLASCGGGMENGELSVWDPEHGKRIYAVVEHPGAVNGIAWVGAKDRLISGGDDGRLRWWDMQNGTRVREVEAHHGTIQSLARSLDGMKLASCGDDGAIMIWDLDRGEHLQTLRRDRPYERLNITGIRGLTEAQKATLRALGAIEQARIG